MSTLQNYLFYFAAEIFLSGPGYDVGSAEGNFEDTQAVIALGLIYYCV